MSTILTIIDPQRDFMDLDGSALSVPGACADMARLAGFIRKNGPGIDNIMVTLDTHTPMHIAHPVRWVDPVGNHPTPFMTITVEDVERGVFRASDPQKQVWHLEYVRSLRERGNKTLTIWPPHCIRKTRGHEVVESLANELNAWTERTGRVVQYLHKGQHDDTEQYGAFAADVPIETAPETMFNHRQVERILRRQRHIWAGEALSHCLMASFEQVYQVSGASSYERIILIDATSPVQGFEKMANEWLEAKRAEGVRLLKTTELVL